MSLWSLSDEILFKYASGFVNELPDKMSQMVGYPEWWLKAVGYPEGPPPPPTKPKCCHPPKPLHDGQEQEQQHIDNVRSNHTGQVGVNSGGPVLTGKAAMKKFLRDRLTER